MTETALTKLKGIGPKTAEDFRKMGIETAEDLLRLYPAGYDRPEPLVDMDEAPEDVPVAVKAVLMTTPENRGFGKKTVTTARISDGSASLNVAFFHMPYLKKALHKGDEKVFRGVITNSRYGLRMEHPALFEPEEYEKLLGEIHPLYSLPQGISQNKMRAAVRQALQLLPPAREFLPESLIGSGWMTEDEARRQIHFPESEEALIRARERLVFEEFLCFILRIRLLKAAEPKKNPCPMPDSAFAERFLQALPYSLTGAQQRVWAEIRADLSGEKRMNRLIQGDVGSGKTVLAILGLLTAAENGYQSALMAPTEVLAAQHFEKMTKLFREQNIDLRVVLLTGSVKESAKKIIRSEIADGRADIVIGTHALIQDAVEFARLGLVVTDEQHRFGVRQRETLGGKGTRPHTLVMSATPIPRTLAIILYGDLDISVVDELPHGRLPIKNCVVTPKYRGSAYRFMQKEIEAGHQIYVICPLVEESELMDGENVQDYSAMLREIFPESVEIGLLHGRMKPREKDEVMERFLKNEIQILVSTTVVEVGVDVPNATVMMVENAERFGLAQLHQLRGRVGRSDAQSYAIFVDGSGNKKKKERLEILNRSNDGFEIAAEDLKLRGPGDLFGIRQSGEMQFAVGDIYNDHEILLKAAEAATALLKADPGLESPENRALRSRVGESRQIAEAL